MNPWKILVDSVRGSSHRRRDEPCQDHGLASSVSIGGEEILIAACSDGAGSAPLSGLGSRLACDILVTQAARALRSDRPISSLARDDALAWLGLIRSFLTRDMACTLLAAIVGRESSFFLQIGDGAIVVDSAGIYVPVFWPRKTGYFNVTSFVTDPDFESALCLEWCEGPIERVALFTDGLELVALEWATRQAHQKFFAPIFAATQPQLHDFLESPRLEEHTGDDRTLILATRDSHESARL